MDKFHHMKHMSFFLILCVCQDADRKGLWGEDSLLAYHRELQIYISYEEKLLANTTKVTK